MEFSLQLLMITTEPGTRFFWNISTNLPHYMASHSRRWWPL